MAPDRELAAATPRRDRSVGFENATYIVRAIREHHAECQECRWEARS
jgi:hypothetical protein